MPRRPVTLRTAAAPQSMTEGLCRLVRQARHGWLLAARRVTPLPEAVSLVRARAVENRLALPDQFRAGEEFHRIVTEVGMNRSILLATCVPRAGVESSSTDEVIDPVE